MGSNSGQNRQKKITGVGQTNNDDFEGINPPPTTIFWEIHPHPRRFFWGIHPHPRRFFGESTHTHDDFWGIHPHPRRFLGNPPTPMTIFQGMKLCFYENGCPLCLLGFLETIVAVATSMESSLLRSGVAAAQLALQTPVKKEEGDVKQEEKPERKLQISPESWYIFSVFVCIFLFTLKQIPQNNPTCSLHIFYFLPTKEKSDDSLAKTRKTEWQAAVKKLPGDTTFVQAWAYISVFPFIQCVAKCFNA